MKILIVDDHVLFREGLAAIIRPEPDVEICGLAGSVHEAVEMVDRSCPEIVLMDFNLPDGSGADATRQILRNHPACKVIFLSMSDEDDHLFSAIRSGAKGYLLKNMRPSKLMASIRSVAQGESALSRTMTLRLMEELSRTHAVEPHRETPHEKLTPRELDVLKDLACGMTNQEIAKHLFLSENTVKYHVHSILDKLSIPDRKAAAHYAREYHLVS